MDINFNDLHTLTFPTRHWNSQRARLHLEQHHHHQNTHLHMTHNPYPQRQDCTGKPLHHWISLILYINCFREDLITKKIRFFPISDM